MTWYRFWKKSGPMQGLSEGYVFYSDKVPELRVEGDCERWAGRMPGGHETYWRYGFQKIRNPPKSILQKMILREFMSIDGKKRYLGELEHELERMNRGKRKKKD